MVIKSISNLVRCGRGVLAAGAGALAMCAGAGAQSIDMGPFVNPANGNSYYLLKGTSDWNRFQSFARSMGGDLVTINDAEEQAWVYQTLAMGFAYIGINDVAEEGTYVWSSGQPVDFTFWLEGGLFPDYDYGYITPGELNGAWAVGLNNWWYSAIAEFRGGDVCLSATPLVIGGDMAMGTTVRATNDPGERSLCGQLGPSFEGPAVWYRFTGDGTVMRVFTCSPLTTSDTVLFVMSGECGALACVGYNDDADCAQEYPYTSSLQFVTECGVDYFVAVKTFQNGDPGIESGPFAIGVETVPNSPSVQSATLSVSSSTSAYVVTSSTNAYDAHAFATSMGGTLAAVTSPAVNDDLRIMLGNIGLTSVIIGLTSCDGGGYEWLSGDPVAYTNWGPAEPAPGHTACMDLGNGTWFTIGDDLSMAALLEFRNDLCEHAAPLDPLGPAVEFNGRATQQKNETPCGDVTGGGTWYRFTGEGANVILGVSPSTPGAGLDATIRVFEGSCGDLSCLTGAQDEPAAGAPTQLVMYAELGREYRVLVSGSCSTGMFIVSRDFQAPTMPSVVATELDDDECAQYVLFDNTDWSRCRDAARMLGMDLVTIEDAERNERIRSFTQKNIPSKGTQSVWIGLTDRDGEGEFAWADGSPVKYTNWLEDQPDNASGIQDYAMMNVGDGTWSDEYRNSGAYGVARQQLTTTVGGVIRGCLDLYGSNNNVDLNAVGVTWGAQTTIECWVSTTEPGVIISEASHAGDGWYVPVLYVGVGGAIHGAAWMGDVGASVVNGPIVTDGKWRHVALTHDGYTLRLIVDGELWDERDGQVVKPQAFLQYVLGSGRWETWPDTDGNWSEFSGSIDELRVWNTARSIDEIRSTMSTRYFNPYLYKNLQTELTFDEGGGSLMWNFIGEATSATGEIGWAYEDRDGNGATDRCQPLCEADIDGNGVVNSTDVSAFVNLWFGDQAADTIDADFNRDGVSNSTDVSDYINLWFVQSATCGG